MISTDVLVIGAGFAGITAARELGNAGKDVIVLEARDRIGGRTWLEERMGKPLELGGTWVHWTQPYVWAEMTRYGIGTVQSPLPSKAWWYPEDAAVEIDPDELILKMDQANRDLTADARKYFENPFTPLANSELDDIDHITVKEKLDSIPMADDVRVLMESFWVLNFNGPIEDGAYSQALRWAALTNGDWSVCFEACATYKFEGGTKALIEAIAADVTGDIVFNSPVASITTTDDGVIVTSKSGVEYSAKSVIVTVGLHALGDISFTPPLSASRSAAIDMGQAAKGVKVWIKVKGPAEPFVAFGKADWELNFFQADVETPDGNRLVIAFGPDQSRIDGNDIDAVTEVLHRLRPDLEVLAVETHDWVGDEYSQQTWPMHKPGFLTKHLADLQKTDGRVILSGTDFANGWSAFIDGAIESGLTAARTVIDGK